MSSGKSGDSPTPGPRRDTPEAAEDGEGLTGAARALPLAAFAGTAAVHFAVWGAVSLRPVTIYPLAASLRAAGALESVRVPDFSPFYFHLHLLLAHAASSYGPFLHAVEILAASLTAALFARLCLELFPARVAAAGTILFALSPAPLLLSHLLLPEVWRLLFDVAALLSFVLFRRTRLVRYVVVCALCLGFSTATRPTGLIVAAALAAALLVAGGRRELRPAAVLLAGPLVVLLALGLRNAALTGRADPTVMDPGAVFYLGNNAASRGTVADSPLLKQMEADVAGQPDYVHVLYKRFPAVALGHSVSASEASRYWSRKAAAFLRRYPGRALRLLGEKLGLLARAWEAPDSIPARELEHEMRSARIPFVPFSLLVALAAAGLFARRRRLMDDLPLLLSGAACAASVLLFYVNTRMRAPLVPYAALFACAGLDALARGAGRRAWTAVAGGGATVLLLFALLSVPTAAGTTLRHGMDTQYAAALLRAQAADLRNRGQRPAAAAVVARAVATAPCSADEMTLANLPYPSGGPLAASIPAARAEVSGGAAARERLFDLGVLLFEAGDLPTARTAFTDLEASAGRFDRGGRCAPAPAFYLARIVERSGGDLRDAERLFLSALRTAPGDAATLAHLSAFLEAAGRGEEAAARREELFATRPDVDAAFALGKACLERGRARDAALWLGRVAAWLPDFRHGRLYAAAAFLQAGDVPGAVAHAEAAFALREDPAVLGESVLPAYAEAARATPDSAAARTLLGRALRRYGRFAEARARLDEALALDPAFEPARRELTLLARATSGS